MVPRPPTPGVRWTPPERWHVTLAFLGEVGEDEEQQAGAALIDAAHRVAGVPEAVAGPETTVLGRSVLCLPVTGVEAAASAVRTAALGHRLIFDPRPFVGHLTLARSRGVVPPALVGTPASARWEVGDITLVASRIGPTGPRYEVLARATVR
ncbi:MAG: 2'-5' RNA ligase family protein [Acidimicrobiales bacterium]